MGDLAKCLPVTLASEGGWANDPHDPGGATMKGVTLATFRRYRPGATAADLRNISDATLLDIYNDGYFKPIAGGSLPPGVDLAAFDYAVNSGVGAARKALVAAGALAPVPRVKAICARRLSILHGLKTWAYFGRGWNARVTRVLALGIRWASGSPALAAKELQTAASEHARKAKTKGKIAAASGSAAGVSLPGLHPAMQSHVPTVAVAALIVAALAAMVVLAFMIYRHQQTAAALSAAAQEG
jgi:lysozyme family protein